MRSRHTSSRAKGRKQLLLIILAIVLLIVGGKILQGLIKYGQVATQVVFNKNIELKKTEERVNILLLGIGGGRHQGPNLTDTIIFASIDPKTKKATLVSIPRDFWVPELKAKINTAYAFGQEKQQGGGLRLTKAVVSKILGQPIDYVLRVDFNGFVKAVDMVGGITVTVDRAFDDYEYPISGKEEDTCGFEGEEFEKRATEEAQLEAFPCRYEHLHFDAGPQQMNGETALKFVRSRHASGVEGTDFARSKRQEKVISAFKDKVLSANTFLNPIKLVSLYDVFKDSIDTDIQQEEYDDFIKLAQKMQDAKLSSVVLDSGDEVAGKEGLLIEPTPSANFRGQWVVIPREGAGNYTGIQQYVACAITNENCPISPTKTITKE
jgi:polyisoprenyl-teichoic acid--peptidoglycan teichoic acid transferase